MKNKKFDCVQMKWELQRKLREEFPDLTDQERRARQMERVAKNPILGRFVKRTLRSASPRP